MNKKSYWELFCLIFLVFLWVVAMIYVVAMIGINVYLLNTVPGFRPVITTRPNQFYVPPTNQELP